MLLSWRLWLAREIVKDNPLPWQKADRFNSGRVAQGFPALLRQSALAADPKPEESLLVGLKVSRAQENSTTVVKKDYAKTENH